MGADNPFLQPNSLENEGKMPPKRGTCPDSGRPFELETKTEEKDARMRGSFSREAAETLALKALAWLASMPDDIERFLNVTGVEAGELRARAGEPEFLAAVMDFLLADDKLLTGFCDSEGLDPKDIHLARRALPGAHEP